MLNIKKLENLILLSFLPIYTFIIQAHNSLQYPNATFIDPKLNIMLFFIITILLLKLLSHTSVHLSDLPMIFRSQPLYIKLLPLLIISIAISNVLAINPVQAWTGYDSNRTAGYFMFMCIIVFWIYAKSNIDLTKALVTTIIILSFLSVLEYLGFRPLSFIETPEIYQTITFPAATIGHRGYLAGLMAFLFGLTLLMYKQKKQNLYLIPTFLCALTIGTTTNSTAFIAIVITVLVFTILELRNKNYKVAYIILLTLIGYGMYYPLQTVNKVLLSHHWVYNSTLSKNLNDVGTLKTRLYLWKSGINIALSHPLFGMGGNSYSQNWYKYISQLDGDTLVKMELGIKPQQKFVRSGDIIGYMDDDNHIINKRLNYLSSHNGIVDFLDSYGIVGFSILLVIFYNTFYYIHKYNRQLVLYIVLPFLAYLVYLMAWFIVVPVLGIIVILSGWIVNEFIEQKIDKKRGGEYN